MKIGYLDCASGASGDMTLGALVDAGASLEAINAAIDSLGLPGCRLSAEQVRRAGFRATRITVHYEVESRHRGLDDILARIEASRLLPEQKKRAAAVFRRLAEAEARVHGVPIEEVHFHELGAADTMADVVGTVVGLDLLGVKRLLASPVPTGSGTIQIAHGRCSVPAPATAELLRGIPVVESSVEAELTTPTGAALLATLVERFGPWPTMTPRRIGCGAGGRDLAEQPNLLRLVVGDAEELDEAPEHVWIVETNLDDATGQMIGYCTERLWVAGALDVFSTAIQMKKNRPGVKLSILCRAETLPAVEAILFEETTALGVRRWPAGRRVLGRQAHRVETPWGPVEGKVAWLADGVARFAPEYESCRQIAAARSVAFRTVYESAQKAFNPADVKPE